MARGTLLSALRTLLRAEISESQEANTAADLEFNYALANKQLELANAYDWPFLSDRWDVACAAGSRYLSMPTQNVRLINSVINFQRPVQVYRSYNSRYAPVEYGISINQLNCHNSDASPAEAADPIQRWALESNVGDASQADQIEIWPIPASAQTLRIEGQRSIRTLTSDSDKADLDDLLLVFFVAADYQTRRQSANAALATAKAAAHLLKLRAGYPTDNNGPLVFGRSGSLPRSQIRTVPTIAIA